MSVKTTGPSSLITAFMRINRHTRLAAKSATLSRLTRWATAGAAGLALVASMAAPSSAAVVSYGYTGTVSSGTDIVGMFGGGNLAGATVSVFASYDPTAYASKQFNVSGGPYDLFFNDTIGASTITVSLTTLLNQTYIRTLTNNGPVAANDVLVSNASGSGVGVYGAMVGFAGNSATLQSSLSTSDPWVTGSSIFGAPGFPSAISIIAATDAGSGNSDSIQINNLSEASPAPEPATLTLLGAGMLSLAGLRGRRRKAT